MMASSPIPFTFQCYLGLSPRDEMEIFNVINGRAKGLDSSLLDFHKTRLLADLETDQPELYIAKRLNDDPRSVLHGRVRLGGAATQGAKRPISLRGLQTATKLFLRRLSLGSAGLTDDEVYRLVRDFWGAVATVWPAAWDSPRTHLLTKGVGISALCLLAGDVVTTLLSQPQRLDLQSFFSRLVLLSDFDWSTKGPFRVYGGKHGASQLHQVLLAKLLAPGLANLPNRHLIT
jgi:hypothetical protein